MNNRSGFILGAVSAMMAAAMMEHRQLAPVSRHKDQKKKDTPERIDRRERRKRERQARKRNRK